MFLHSLNHFLCMSVSDFEISKPMKTFVGSITDQSVVNEACDGVDVVLHIASLIDWRLFPNQKTLHEVNVTGNGE